MRKSLIDSHTVAAPPTERGWPRDLASTLLPMPEARRTIRGKSFRRTRRVCDLIARAAPGWTEAYMLRVGARSFDGPKHK